MEKAVKIEVEKYKGKYKVSFWIGNQGFMLEYGGTKAEATWMKKMLEKAFANYEKILVTNYKELWEKS